MRAAAQTPPLAPRVDYIDFGEIFLIFSAPA
jgi:hypothetical protein